MPLKITLTACNAGLSRKATDTEVVPTRAGPVGTRGDHMLLGVLPVQGTKGNIQYVTATGIKRFKVFALKIEPQPHHPLLARSSDQRH